MQVSSIANNLKNNDLYSQYEQLSATDVKMKKYLCTVDNCKKSFFFNCRLEQHILTYHSAKQYNCNICANNFNTERLLNRHQQTHRTRDYTCDTCKNSYFHKSSLIFHIKQTSHTASSSIELYKQSKCKFCIETFKTKQELMQHHKKCHPSIKPFACRDCDKTYNHEMSLSRHYIAIHQNKNKDKKIKNYKCDLCPAIITKKESLEEHHKQEHFGKKPYVCDVCNARFLSEIGKKKHKNNKHAAQGSNQVCKLIDDADIIDMELDLSGIDTEEIFDLDYEQLVYDYIYT
jgi:KRAB domain-containing zinc finger protein